MKQIPKRFHIIKDMQFLQRMILVYLIGGIIPLIVASIYTNLQSRKMMISVTEDTQMEETAVLGSSIRESMSVLDNVARLLCMNDEVIHLATKKYKNRTSFYKDYNSMTAISDYMTYYQQDISYINIYLNNASIRSVDLQRMKYLSHLGTSASTTEWYQKTVDLKDEGYWYFGTMPEDAYENSMNQQDDFSSLPAPEDQTIQISRALRDKNGNTVGIVTVLMQYQKTKEALDSRSTDTAIFYNDVYPVYSNFNMGDGSFITDSIRNIRDSSGTQRAVHGIEEYLVSYQRIQREDAQDYFSVVSVRKYRDIMKDVNTISVQTFVPEIIGIGISFILIFAFAASYGRRLNSLRVQMHRVAQGEYDLVEPVEGNDEIGQLYLDVESMMKDIQQLMDHVVYEQVQKEKLHTRQKEVEFKMLASQINPHFLYNTLETIRMKAMVNHQKEIADLVKMLAKTMRYSIQVTDQLVTLKEELQMAEYYLKIQNYRFGDRIHSSLEVEPEVDQKAKILPLTIQPFVENAFVHGLEEKDKDGMLTVRVRMDGEDICIEIKDNGMGMDYYDLGKLRRALKEEGVEPDHIGVRNVNQRIKLLFGEDYGVDVDSKKNVGTTVTVRIPYWQDDEGR